MRRPRALFASRLLRTGLLLVFGFGSPSIGGAFRCCSSGAHMGGATPASPATHHVASSDAHAAHGGQAGRNHDHSTTERIGQAPAEPAGLFAPCTCVDDCCSAPLVACDVPQLALPEAGIAVATPPSFPAREHRPDARGRFLLPFANGPPATLTA